MHILHQYNIKNYKTICDTMEENFQCGSTGRNCHMQHC